MSKVRKNYPQAFIYIASGPMLNDIWHPENKSLTTVKRYLQRIDYEMHGEGETKLRQIHFDPQNGKVDGLGAGTHPNNITHAKMAKRWIETIQDDLGWKRSDPQP